MARREKTGDSLQKVNQQLHSPALKAAGPGQETDGKSLLQQAISHPQSLKPTDIMQMQSIIGNRSLTRLIEKTGCLDSSLLQKQPRKQPGQLPRPGKDGHSLKTANTATNHASPYQFTIVKDDKKYPTTWLRLKASGQKDLIQAAEAIMTEVKAKIEGEPDQVKLMSAWNKLARNDLAYDVVEHHDTLVGLVFDSYNRSMQARRGFESRKRQASEITKSMREKIPGLKFAPDARAPQMLANSMQVFSSSPIAAPMRFATHVSTMILDRMPGGIEAQGALAKDKSSMFLSMNNDEQNRELRGSIHTAGDLEELAVQQLGTKGLDVMTRPDAMKNRVVRHMLKLLRDIKDRLPADAPIKIPVSKEDDFDGLHAEIRIIDDPSYDRGKFEPPTGTKLPCLGCYLYINGKEIKIGHRHGPMWVTNSALAMQLKEALKQGHTIGKLEDAELGRIAAKLAADYQKAILDGAQMGLSRTKAGGATDQHDADSGSELDDDEYERLRARVAKKPKTT